MTVVPEPFYQYKYPTHYYPDFNAIPPLVIQSLLFIENNLEPQGQPAQDWPRFAKAALSQVGKALDMQDQSAGGRPWRPRWRSIVILPMA